MTIADDEFEEFSLDDDPEKIDMCIVCVDAEFPTATREVRQQILSYADGNMGAATLLARLCRVECCIAASEVTALVGWPLVPTDLRQEEGWQLYLRLKSGYLPGPREEEAGEKKEQ